MTLDIIFELAIAVLGLVFVTLTIRDSQSIFGRLFF